MSELNSPVHSDGGVVFNLDEVNGEIRTVSQTGGEKGVKPQAYDLIPVGPLAVVAEL